MIKDYNNNDQNTETHNSSETIFIDALFSADELDFLGRSPSQHRVIYLYPVADSETSIGGKTITRYNKAEVESYL